MEGICDVLDHPHATFEIRVPGKTFKSLLNAIQEMTGTDCHLILTREGIEIKEASPDWNMMIETCVPWSNLAYYEINIPKGCRGLIMKVNFKSLMNVSNVGKDVYLSLVRTEDAKVISVFDRNSPKSKNQVIIMEATPPKFTDFETWTHSLNDPEAVEPASEQASNFQSKSKGELILRVFPRGVSLQTEQSDGQKRGSIGEVPDPNSPFYDPEDESFLEINLIPSQIKSIHQLCKICDTTLKIHINPQYDHIKITLGIGSLCNVCIYLF